MYIKIMFDCHCNYELHGDLSYMLDRIPISHHNIRVLQCK